MKHVNLIDATLREGAQAPGVNFSKQDSIEIAQQLNKLKVNTITQMIVSLRR